MYRTVKLGRLRGLRGFVGQRAPRYPYGLGGLRGFVGQRPPKYPYGLGCDSCTGKRLGQDDNGDQYTDLMPSYGPPEPPVGASGSGPASGPGYDFEPLTGPLQTYTAAGWSSLTPAAPAASPVYDVISGQPVNYSTASYAGAGLPTVTSPAAIAPSSTAAYLPYILIGLGGIALIAVAKRR